jgi:mono/diheme cytochrome c family protein
VRKRRPDRTTGSLAALALTACVAFAATAAAQDTSSPFVAYGCYQCHGYVGQGGVGVRIAPSAYSFDAFAALVRRPANEMPAYAREVLSDADLRIIYEYVRSMPEPPPVTLR